jgi:hypothetical protein
MVGHRAAVANRERLVPQGVRRGDGRIIHRLPEKKRGSTMEAEQLNQIANTLAGLRDREAQLRRYL